MAANLGQTSNSNASSSSTLPRPTTNTHGPSRLDLRRSASSQVRRGQASIAASASHSSGNIPDNTGQFAETAQPTTKSAFQPKVDIDRNFSQESQQRPDNLVLDAPDTDGIALLSGSEDLLAKVLERNDMLGSLCEEALLSTGRSRTIENFERLLELWYLDRRMEDISPRQRRCILPLAIKRVRIQIARRVADSHAAQTKGNPSRVEEGMGQGPTRVNFLDEWIASKAEPQLQSSPGLSQLLMIGNVDVIFEAGVPETKRIQFFEDIMTNSIFFRDLVTEFQLSQLPSSLHPLINIIRSFQHVNLWFSSRRDRSVLNRMKILAEQSTGYEWDWWPLRPKLRALRDNELRLFWKCVSSISSNRHKTYSMTYSIAVRRCGRSFQTPMPEQSITFSSIGTLILSCLILVR